MIQDLSVLTNSVIWRFVIITMNSTKKVTQKLYLQRFQSWITCVRYFSRTSFPFGETQNEHSALDSCSVTRQFQERRWRVFSSRKIFSRTMISFNQLWKRCNHLETNCWITDWRGDICQHTVPEQQVISVLKAAKITYFRYQVTRWLSSCIGDFHLEFRWFPPPSWNFHHVWVPRCKLPRGNVDIRLSSDLYPIPNNIILATLRIIVLLGLIDLSALFTDLLRLFVLSQSSFGNLCLKIHVLVFDDIFGSGGVRHLYKAGEDLANLAQYLLSFLYLERKGASSWRSSLVWVWVELKNKS